MRAAPAWKRAEAATEQRIAELTGDLSRVTEALRTESAAMEKFAYLAGHELQAPLRKLTAFADLLRRDLGDELPPRAAKDIGLLIGAAGQMRAIVEGLLALSRVGAAAKHERVSLHECADWAIEALAERVAGARAKILRDDLPEVHADPALLTQVYQHLIDNALKFAGGDRPVVHLTVDHAGGQVVLGVQDYGTGFHPRYAERIFAPFERLGGRGHGEGAGIGLAICRKCIEVHGGRIWAEAETGKGAHFKFTLHEERTRP